MLNKLIFNAIILLIRNYFIINTLKILKKTIIAHFFTTINFSMLKKALMFLLLPFFYYNFKTWKSVWELEKKVLKYVKNDWKWKILSFYNCRTAIYQWLKLMWIWDGDEVIIQAFTCVSVPNPIIQTWAVPIYVDIDDTLNIDPDLIENKINNNTKAILVQHTFWNPADIIKIKNICDKHWLFLIEDCAHSLWSEFNWKKLWNYWDIACFSFWRDKVVSSVNWGFLIINNQKLYSRLDNISESLIDAPIWLIVQNLIYIIISYLSKIFYDIFIWKLLICFSRKLWIVPELLSNDEKKCNDNNLHYRMPNCLAYIWISEFAKINKYNQARSKIAKIYNEILSKNQFAELIKINTKSLNIFLRYVLLVKNKKQLINHFRKSNVLLWNWYSHIIDPAWVNLSDAGYIKWSCPKAENYSQQSVNLPNYFWFSQRDLKKVIALLKKYLK